MNHTPDIPQGYMQDAKGRLVPTNMVRDFERLEDSTVKKVLEYAHDLNAQIARFKAHCHDDLATLMDLLAEQYNVTKRGQTGKGNITFQSYDGLQKVQVNIADHIDFGPELQIAKDLIDACINDWAGNAKDELRALVTHAFNTQKTGRINREALFKLRTLKIEDERWQNAMQAINDSIRIVGSKSYIRFYTRQTQDAPWRAITIDIAKA